MKNKGLERKPTGKKFLLQGSLSVILLLLLVSVISTTWGLIGEEDRPDLWFLSELNEGRYAQCASSYALYWGSGETSGKEFDQFREFYEFYERYILGVEYGGAAREGELRGCLEEMKRICADTQYPDMVPHYEYLIRELENFEDGLE